VARSWHKVRATHSSVCDTKVRLAETVTMIPLAMPVRPQLARTFSWRFDVRVTAHTNALPDASTHTNAPPDATAQTNAPPDASTHTNAPPDATATLF
jgi:hypothetical protein